ncbi:hypothetical protein [Ktedonobacter robiniae]|uniref:DUF4405 domain-containing protein n=1 Tax=Ktedonobacter robiniae TaxID=2778365 RepID=A0ABQ3UNV3_9CHLR|nr:hypothetical protein [Ktedonobacter robiniae]GHO54454.1 hypothetical protein KSB_29290 [Ktedonobacter robiniae]
MKTLSNHESGRPAGPTSRDAENAEGRSGVVGNERMTALAGVVLLVLLLIELISSVSLHAGMAIHIVVGVLLSCPLLVKLASTGYRFLRYYTRAPAYVRKGPPSLPRRLLAPLLVVTTLLVVGSGMGLVVTGPTNAGLLMRLHDLSVLLWISLIALHVGAYLWRAPRLVADDWRKPSDRSLISGRKIRLGVNIGAGLSGAVVAMILFPGVAPWVTWSQANQKISSPVVVGLVIAAVASVSSRPWKWK